MTEYSDYGEIHVCFVELSWPVLAECRRGAREAENRGADAWRSSPSVRPAQASRAAPAWTWPPGALGASGASWPASARRSGRSVAEMEEIIRLVKFVGEFVHDPKAAMGRLFGGDEAATAVAPAPRQ